MPNPSDLLILRDKLRAFAEARDWDQFHSPKNLSMALMVEAAELMEHFQWLTEAQSGSLAAEDKAAVAEELADILLYLVRLADKLGVDLPKAALHSWTMALRSIASRPLKRSCAARRAVPTMSKPRSSTPGPARSSQ